MFLKISWGPATLSRRDSNTGVVLWNLRNFYKRFFYRRLPMAASEITVLFYVKKYFRTKKKRRQKLITLLIYQVLLLKWKNASFVAMNMILKTIPKTRLVLFVTLIDKLCSYQSNFFPYKQILFAMYFFFDFLISLITETIRSSCLFQFIRPILKFLQWC